MHTRTPLTGLLLATTISFTLPAHAALQARDLNNDTVTDTYYDTVLDITWLADANLAASNAFGVNGIGSNGSMSSWNTAQTWIDAMNDANYLGYSDWRLPTTGPVNGTAFIYSSNSSTAGDTDVGYNISAPGTVYAGSTGSEMAYLFFNTLGNKALVDPTTGQYPQGGYGLTNKGPFQNFQSNAYWSGTEYAPNPSRAWYFNTTYGHQTHNFKGLVDTYAMAVLPGDVTSAPVPEADSYLLLSIGIVLVGWLARRRG